MKKRLQLTDLELTITSLEENFDILPDFVWYLYKTIQESENIVQAYSNGDLYLKHPEFGEIIEYVYKKKCIVTKYNIYHNFDLGYCLHGYLLQTRDQYENVLEIIGFLVKNKIPHLEVVRII